MGNWISGPFHVLPKARCINESETSQYTPMFYQLCMATCNKLNVDLNMAAEFSKVPQRCSIMMLHWLLTMTRMTVTSKCKSIHFISMIAAYKLDFIPPEVVKTWGTTPPYIVPDFVLRWNKSPLFSHPAKLSSSSEEYVLPQTFKHDIEPALVCLSSIPAVCVDWP